MRGTARRAPTKGGKKRPREECTGVMQSVHGEGAVHERYGPLSTADLELLRDLGGADNGYRIFSLW